jgi:hypothetical protein
MAGYGRCKPKEQIEVLLAKCRAVAQPMIARGVDFLSLASNRNENLTKNAEI